jgi:hypothetical protein
MYVDITNKIWSMCIFVNIGTVYDLIFKDDIKQITKVYERFRNSYETRKHT